MKSFLSQKAAIVTIAIAITLIMAFSFTVYAATSSNPKTVSPINSKSSEALKSGIIMMENSPNAYVNGCLVEIDAKNPKITPVVKNKITYVPLIFICDSLYGKYGWDDHTSSTVAFMNNKEIKFKEKSSIATVKGSKVKLEGPVLKLNGQVYIPVKGLASLIGKKLFTEKGLIILSDKTNVLDKKQDAKYISSLLAIIKVGKQQKLFPDSSPGSNPSNAGSSITLEKYEKAGVFTMLKPKGWSVYKAGEYNTLAFLARDKNEPLRQIFCFSEIGPFYTSEQQKQVEQNYVSSGGYSIQWIDMPVVSPLNGTAFVQKLNDIFNTAIGKGFLSMYGMPKITGIEKTDVISEKKLPAFFQGTGTAAVRTLLFNNGKAAEGLIVVSGAPDAYGHAYAFMVTGIIMPKNEFNKALPTLTKAVESFTLDQSYLQRGMQAIQKNGEMLQQISKTLSQTSDSIMDTWNSKSKSEDILTEKESDKNLGYERVYDVDTGEVYQVENGFYDEYQANPIISGGRTFEPLPDDDYNLWTQAPKWDDSLNIH